MTGGLSNSGRSWPIRNLMRRGYDAQGAAGRLRVGYFVPPSKHFAGIERVVHELASGLMESHGDVLDVHVLFSSRYENDILVNTPYKLHVLGVDRLRNLIANLRACVARERFDVLVCPQVEASVMAWLATRGLGVPVFISHLHGNPRIEEKEGSRRSRMAFSLFRHIISRRIAGVMAVSPSLGRYAAESLTPHAPVYFVKNPVRDLGDAGPSSRGVGPFRFVNVARLSRQKGQDLLLWALSIARPHLPAVSLTLVGSGSEEVELRRLSSDLGLDDLVTFAGYCPDPAAYFRSADCFVLSSRWEGFGVVLVEALHFGLPLLASNCDFGPSDIITDRRIGELVDPDSAKAIAEGLRRAVRRMADPSEEAFRRAVAGSYARKEATEMHFDVLKQIISSNSVRSVRLTAFVSG